MYAQFVKWQLTKFKSMFEEGGVYQHNLYDLIMSHVNAGEDTLDLYRERFPKKGQNEIVKMVADKVKGRDEFILHEVLKELSDEGSLRGMAQKLEDTRDSKGIVWATPWNEFRLALTAFHGWVDASDEVGHFKKGDKK